MNFSFYFDELERNVVGEFSGTHPPAGQSWYIPFRNAVITCGGAVPSLIIVGTRVRRIATTTNRTNGTIIWGSGWPGDVEQA